MSIRMSGLVSGLDTDSIVQELMSAQQTKKQKVVNSQTKLTWQQEIWKDLNTKLYSFYTGSLSKLRTQGNYLTKKVSSSNESAVTATATINATTGAHSVQVKSLASAQYVTSGKVGVVSADGTTSNASTSTKLTELGMEEGTVITIKNGDTEENFTVESGTTIKDFITQCKNAGLNASFDTNQQRFFISSSDSGEANAFSITTGTSLRAGADQEINAMLNGVATDDAVFGDYLAAADTIKEKLNAAIEADGGTLSDAAIDVLSSIRSGDDAEKQTVLTKYGITDEEYDALKTAYDNAKAKDDSSDTLVTAMGNYLSGATTSNELLSSFTEVAKADDSIIFASELTDAYNTLKGMDAEAYENLKGMDLSAATDDDLETAGVTREQYEAYQLLTNKVDKDQLDAQMDIYIANEIGAANPRQDGTSQLTALGLDEIDSTGKTANDNITSSNSSAMSVRWASDAVIVLDGAELRDSSNDFTVNEMTLHLTSTTLNKTTGEYDEIQLSVANDTSAVYDMVKTFVNDYNTLLKEMNEKYNAESARDYDPLTDEQKEAMTDDEIEKWETKIKDSLLRRDDTLSSLTTVMRQLALSTTKVNGKTYSLSSLGITTSSDYTEKGLLHIHGDADDDTYASDTNLLQNMLDEDPQVVMEVLTNAAKQLYDTFTTKMSRTSLSSAMTFYNDIQMTNQQRDYATEISNWDTKLADLEERYYSQFTAMEMAMQKLQSQSSYLSSLFGTSA